MIERFGHMAQEAMNKRKDEDLQHLHHVMTCRLCKAEATRLRTRGLWGRIWDAIFPPI